MTRYEVYVELHNIIGMVHLIILYGIVGFQIQNQGSTTPFVVNINNPVTFAYREDLQGIPFNKNQQLYLELGSILVICKQALAGIKIDCFHGHHNKVDITPLRL